MEPSYGELRVKNQLINITRNFNKILLGAP